MAVSLENVVLANGRKLRVVVVSAVRVHGDALVASLRGVDDIEVTGSFLSSDVEVTAIAKLPSPLDAILFDDSIVANLCLIQELHHQLPSVRLIALGVGESEEEIVSCAKAGMAGYIDRHAKLEDLPHLIVSVVEGELVCSPTMAAKLFRRLAENSAETVRDRPLTSRECDVLRLIRYGLANKEIAGELQISEATVKNHVHHLLEKLQVKRRVQAARLEVTKLPEFLSRAAHFVPSSSVRRAR
jgi:DNA-binding NarL/FixJ family response regulator